MKKMKVNLDRKQVNSYDIYIGQDILDRSVLIMGRNNWAKQYFIVADSNVAAVHAGQLSDKMKASDLRVDTIDFPAGEKAKTLSTCLNITERLASLGADRTSAIIALGGGVTGDVAGLTASLYMRGIPCIHFPTSLLAQVDSCIGGKTGVDLAAGKNLIGTFHQPKAVFIDASFLKTLAEQEFRNGLAEIVKYAIIESPELARQLENNADQVKNKELAFLEGIISTCCRIKKGIVEIDEKEMGLRRILNFGHTVGHALEAESDYTIPHGDAVAVGMAAATGISHRMNYLGGEEASGILSFIRKMGLADRIAAGIETDALLARLKVDKKKQGDNIHFVLLKKMGMPFVNGGVPEAIVRESIEGLRHG
jgi:3-dehydroquinate synthase